MAATGETGAATRRFAEAYRTLRADPDVQFELHRADPPPQPPAWWTALEHLLHRVFAPVVRFFDWLGGFLPRGPWAQILLWIVLGVAAAGVLAMIVIRLSEGQWRWPVRRARPAVTTEPPEQGWAPEAAPARALLAEADALAADGRFAEAAHLLLQRSVEDIARRRPQLVRPALTSRDLAAAAAIPPAPRDLFAGIARLVERSLFGGRPVGEPDWLAARSAYADFALPRGWSAA